MNLGQYWKVCSLTKKEYVSPHKLGTGFKLWEQLANHPGTGAALIILCAAMPEGRGGGDLDTDEEGFVGDLKKAAGVSYADVAKRTIGRWAGDRIALIGDYAEKGDLKPRDNANLIYELCASDEDRQKQVAWLKKLAEERGKQEYTDKANRLAEAQLYKDISEDVCAVIEHELHGKFTGEGWREFERR